MSIVISLFDSAMKTAPESNIEFDEYLTGIKIGAWQDEVLKYRAKPSQELKKAIKAVSPSGRFKTRNLEGLESHSGVLCMDLDQKDNPDMRIDRLQCDPYVYAYHQSVGGFGYAVYFLIDPTKHAEAFQGIERYLADHYAFICDPACKDMSRLRFVSYDPYLYKRESRPAVFKLYLKPVKTKKRRVYPHTSNDIEYILQQISNRGIDLTSSYHDWTQIGFAFAAEYGERGRDYFHVVSQQNPEYSEAKTDSKYNNFLKTHQSRVSIATFFWRCKDAGIDLQTEETRKVERYTKFQMLQGFKSDADIIESVQKLAKQDGINPEIGKQIAEQTLLIPKEDLKKEKTDNLLPEIRSALAVYDLKRNEVTNNVEYQGRPLTDWDVNTIWGELANNLGQRCAKSTVEDIINSDATPSYNPFLEFFEANKHVNSEGNINRLANCIKTDSDDLGIVYVQTYLRKWLVSLIASMHGTYSLLIFVLCGSQGIGKTNFFRFLLPEKLREYYGESKLDHGKDDAMLMCTKIILCDDEFSGKSKSEYKLLKEISSKQTFNMRLPYGRRTQDFRRYAVLCGTSNDNEIINDPTGNRRIVPVNVQSIDFKAYKEIDKTELLMEAYNIYHTEGETSWQLTAKEIELLNKSTANNEQTDIVKEAVLMFFDKPDAFSKEKWLSTTEILNHIQMRTRIQISTTRLGMALKILGFERKSTRINGSPVKVYNMKIKPDYTL